MSVAHDIGLKKLVPSEPFELSSWRIPRHPLQSLRCVFAYKLKPKSKQVAQRSTHLQSLSYLFTTEILNVAISSFIRVRPGEYTTRITAGVCHCPMFKGLEAQARLLAAYPSHDPSANLCNFLRASNSMIPPGPLRQLRHLDKTSPQFREQLDDFFRGDGYRDVFPKLHNEDLAWLAEYLDSVLNSISDHASPVFQLCLHELGKIAGVREVFPGSCALPESLLGCVYEGTFDGAKVRIRRIKMNPRRNMQKVKEVAVMSKYLQHPNIVPLLGVTVDPLELISEWMSGGDLPGYISNHPEADRHSLLSNVAEGLNYLHSCDVVHGDLKGMNILVDAAGHARITDFGLAMFTQDMNLIQSAPIEHGNSVRWIAPEILDGRGSYSKEADIFSFAGVVIEVFTGTVPFSDRPLRAAVLAIAAGERPPRPTHPTLTDGLWALIQRCWDQGAHLRPRALRVVCDFTGIPAWKRLVDHSLTSHGRVSLITDIFSDRDETEAVQNLCGDGAQSFVEVIDETLDNLVPWLRRKCLTALCKICGRQAFLPRSAQIPLCYDRMDTPLYRGGYADVWKGEYQGRMVAVKVLTVYATSDLGKITQMFCREAITWKALRHQNVLPLLGVTMSRNQFAMVGEWMINGNINEYVEKHVDANRFELLKGVARGLMYMHGEGIIHGDLKGANILIDQHGHALLADFGLTAIASDHAYSTTSSSSATGGTTRWMSPERLNPVQFGIKDSRPTKQSDCYVLGMVILEVLSGQVPLTRDCNVFMVTSKVLEGERPGRPQGVEGTWFTDDLWATLQVCWSHQLNDRPAIEAVLECLTRTSTCYMRSVCNKLSVSSIQEVAEDEREVETKERILNVVEEPRPPPPPPRHYVVVDRGSVFVEEPGPLDSPTPPAKQRIKNEWVRRDGGRRSQTTPLPSKPRAIPKKHFTSPSISRGPEEPEKAYIPRQVQIPRKSALLGLSRVRMVFKDLRARYQFKR